jgi:hypothetical protein
MVLINNVYKEIERKIEIGKMKIKIKNYQNNSQYFYITNFCQLISTIKTIYTKDEKIKGSKFDECKEKFIMEVIQYNQTVGNAFSLLLSEKIIDEKNSNIDLFAEGIAGYEQIFKNIYIYTKYYVNKIQKAANNHFTEYKKNKTKEIKNAVDIIVAWFNELIDIFL